MLLLRSLVVALPLLALTGCSSVQSFQPDVPQGGRIVSVARPAGRPNEILAASPSGGLFRSVDGGQTWGIVSGLPSTFINDIAYAPDDPDIIVVSFRQDFRSGVGSGPIWRSSDGGRSWSEAFDFASGVGATCTRRSEAHGISFQPSSSIVYVATACGIAVSDDLGATWNVEAANNGFYALLALDGGRVIAVGPSGVWLRDARSEPWRKAVGAARMWLPITHALAVSPINPQIVMAVGLVDLDGNDALLARSFDGGEHWAPLLGTPSDNREPFVRAAKATASPYFLYLGDGKNATRISVHEAPGVNAQVLFQREKLALEHVDPSDVLFDLDGSTPLLMPGDGGLMNTPDGGATWKLFGGGKQGLNALQVYQVTGQRLGLSDQYTYFGTQDNGVHASKDGGAWVKDFGESPLIQLDPIAAPDEAKVQLLACGECSNVVTGPLLSDPQTWQNAPDVDGMSNTDSIEGVPIRLKSGWYLQNTVGAVAPDLNVLRQTKDWGATWLRGAAALLREDPFGQPVVQEIPGGLSSEFAIYQAYPKTGVIWGSVRVQYGPDGLSNPQFIGLGANLPQYGIVKVGFPTLGNKHVDDGIQSLAKGTVSSAFNVITPLLAADPRNPDNLLAVDIGAGDVKYSVSGGREWYRDDALTALVTQGGRYDFSFSGIPLISAIAWDPSNSCHILVGAEQGGIFRSEDGGASWRHVKDSEQIPDVSSFFFPAWGGVIVSSFGRGLWKLTVDRNVRGCPFRRPPIAARFISGYLHLDPQTGDPQGGPGDNPFPARCEDCSIIVAGSGAIAGAEVDGGRLTRFALKRGNAFQFDARGREIALEFPNVFPAELDGRRTLPGFEHIRLGGKEVKGLVTRKGALVSLVVSDLALPFSPARQPATRLVGKRMIAGVAYADPGEALVLYGTGFAAEKPVEVWIANDIRVIATVKLTPDRAGAFRMNLKASGPRGTHKVVVGQRDGHRLVSAVSIFNVASGDRDEVD